jgi:hypothetical protein
MISISRFNSSMLTKITAVSVALILLSAPLLASDEDDLSEARMTAEMDAKADCNGALWIGAGCLGGLLGLLISYVYMPSPPASRLIGKSPEYVAVYTDAYKEKSRSIQTSNALIGCGLNLVFNIIYVVAVLSSTD